MTNIIEVAAGLIRNGEGKFLICQRPAGKTRGGLWEFAGGKLEPGETPQQALIRECREELAVEVAVGSLYLQLVHEYPDMTIRLFLFNARIKDGTPKLLEHQQLRWIKAEETYDYHFCPADEEILYRIRRDAGCGLDRAKQLI